MTKWMSHALKNKQGVDGIYSLSFIKFHDFKNIENPLLKRKIWQSVVENASVWWWMFALAIHEIYELLVP